MKYAEEENVEKSLHYLATTDVTYGNLKGRVKALEYRLQVAEARGYMEAKGTMGDKKSASRASEAYVSLIDEYEEASCEYLTIGAKRTRAELTIAVWQTCSANKRK